MSNAIDPKAIAAMIKLRDGGAKWPEVLQKTGLNHVIAEREYMRHQFISGGGKVVEATPANVVKLRNEGFSWGQITVRVGAVSEGPVRRLYTEGSGNVSQGLRNGHGGRFFAGDQELYEGALQPTGTVIPKGQISERRNLAFTQRIAKMERGELVQYAKDNGVNPKGKTNAQIALAIAKKIGVNASTAPVAEGEVKAS